MRLSFDDPIWLIALFVLPLIVLAGMQARSGRPRQQRWATACRVVCVAALVLAAAGPRWRAAGEDVDVAFLVDASDSVGANGSDAALTWVNEALGDKPLSARAALALFGADARLEYTLRADPPAGDPAAVVDGSASDLASALRLGQGVLGSDNRRRVVLLTDGRQTRGDAVRTAEELAESGVRVDVVALPGGLAPDVLVEEVDAPSRVREGESFDVVATLRNTGDEPVDVVVVVTADGEEVHRETVTAAPGRTEVVVPRTADETGTVRYEVRLASGASSLPENDVGRAAVQVEGPPKVLVYEREPGAGKDLADALVASGVPADRTDVATGPLPTIDRLLDYDAVVLVDVPVDALGDAGMATLDAFVRDAGHGLIAVGGERSYGMGDYDGTPLEDLLPVFARVKDPKRRPSVAEALVVDVSGSMAACHCQEGGFAGNPGGIEEGGVNKTDITKEAVARAAAALEEQDMIGVLAFNTQNEWVLPLQNLPSQAVVDGALAKLHPEGGTSVPQAVREAIAGLKDANARLRHIVLFTDGFTEQRALVDVAREAAEAGITLSVVGTGEGAGRVLQEMAEVGGGRYYPGRDLFSIPDIIVSEVQFAARPIINEGSFFPVVTGAAPATEDLTSSPPLLGYLATTAKPTARTLLAIGDERDPLLAQWQAGLGTSVAWTSDVSPRWSAQWVTWERYATFWSDVVKSTFPADVDPRFSLQATASTEGIAIAVEAAGTIPAGAEAVATVTGPDGERHEVALERTGLSGFSGQLPGGAEGVFAVTVQIRDGGTVLFSDTVSAIRSYSAEYAVTEADPTLLERIAEAGGGRLNPDAATAFGAAGLPSGAGSRSLWPWFALLGLVLLPVDVGLRRLRLERGDWARTRAWARGRLRRGRMAERGETAEGLLAATARSRRRTAPRPQPAPPPPTQTDAAPTAPPTVPPPTPPRSPRPPAPPPPPAEPAAPADVAPPEPRPPSAPGAQGLIAARDRARRRNRGDPDATEGG